MRPITDAKALIVCACAAAMPPDVSPAHAGPPERTGAHTPAVQSLAERIDVHVVRHWDENNVTPAPPADDAEFLRRVWLDVAGRIPPAYRVREFLADADPDKRRKAVDELLESSGYVTFFATYWRNAMMPEAASDPEVRFLVPGFDAWLRRQLADNARYDQIAREILTVPFGSSRGRMTPDRAAREASPIAFYQAKQIRPEELAAATSRIFLGVRIECAQCHDHPFDMWKREQFWGFAAFFAGIERSGDRGLFGPIRELYDRREMAVPETDRVVQAAYLDGSEPRWRLRVGPRETLAGWITSPDNPYFARAAANRLWGHFFGIGLVDPVDDFGGGNEPSHPELLDELAREFAAHEFDLKFLIRAIAASRAYQLTSRKTHASQNDPRLFARMAVRGLSPEQIYDSLAQATGRYEPFQRRNPYVIVAGDPRSEFLELFADESGTPTERQTTILQALAMMNGRLTADAADPASSRSVSARTGAPRPGSAVRAVAEFPMSTAERIESLYLAALSRPPRPQELARLVKHVESRGTPGDRRRALGDVFWALLNSSEFLFNH